MKRLILLLLIVCFVGSTAACGGDEEFLVKESYKPIYTIPGEGLITVASPTPWPMVTELRPQEAELLTPAPTPISTPVPTPTNSANMYSSLADMITFDPSTGWAQFDYWDKLTGNDAVDWLVSYEGYTQDEAQDIVDDWADTEYIKKNTNPQLRTIDLSVVPVWMLQYPSGYDVAPEPDPELTSFADLCALYSIDPDLLLENVFYYYITVNSQGVVTEVRQRWHP